MLEPLQRVIWQYLVDLYMHFLFDLEIMLGIGPKDSIPKI